MDIKILNPIEFPNWNDQIAELPGATIFHTSNWAHVLSESYGYKPKYFCTLNKGQLQNVIPLMELNSLLTGKRGVSLPFSDQVEPLVTDKHEFDKMFDAIISHGHENGWQFLDFHGGNNFFSNFNPYVSFISPQIELHCSLKQNIDNYRNSNKRNIKKAKSFGVNVKITSDKKSLDEFYRLNCQTRKKHGLPPQPGKFFENIHKQIISKKLGFIGTAYFESRAVAGTVFFTSNSHAIYKYGASDERFLHLRPNNLVMAESIRCAFENGVKTVDLGRTEIGHTGQLQFKRGWNTVDTDVNYFKYNILENKFMNLSPRIKSTYSIFKICPIPFLRLLGKITYRHIG